eukprot:TRINITY_DN2131_c0_g1_i1.p1 TRINITY_DN2131_c0_g1~~TRINITY_DN2131_c0_g1_i1.p1  ORF type:complete len:512 (+),score=225.32 TRINITY_DN2131_c0_g1_i1:48-1538(+)
MGSMARSGAVALLAVCGMAAAADEPQRMSTRGRWIVDEAGRVRLFHGFNDVQHAKGGAFMPGMTTVTSNVERLQRDGFNAMRMPMMWAAANPAEGVYNTTYIDNMKAVTEKLSSQGIYSFLDMHQDVLSSDFHSYDGAPQWVVNKTVPRHAYPWPIKDLKNWAEGYVTEAVGQSFQDIYDNKHGGLDAWGAFWNVVASRFNTSKQILGYELINEPWAGDVFHDPALFLPGEAGKKNLLPAYDHLVEQIRKVDQDTMIFFEPVTWGMVLPGEKSFIGTGFSHLPGGEADKNKCVFSWHYYCWMLNSDYSNSSQGYPWMLKQECDHALLPLVMSTVVKDVTKLETASFLTEFGALTPSASHPDSEGSLEIEAVLAEADKTLQSWTYWDVAGLVDGRLNLEDDKYTPFIRPFAQAVAGTPTHMQYDRKTKKFELDFTADTSITQPTVVAVPKAIYTNGYAVATTPSMNHTPCGEGLLCLTPTSAVKDGEKVEVKVTMSA